MAADRHVVAQTVTETIEQLYRHAYGDSFVAGLNPAQWAALRFLARASALDRTVAGFARWQRSTTGTASQTIAALARKGHVAKSPMSDDRRRIRLDLTESGRDLLRRDPIRTLAQAVERLPDARADGLANGLAELARAALEASPTHTGAKGYRPAAGS